MSAFRLLLAALVAPSSLSMASLASAAELPVAEAWVPSGKRVSPADGLMAQVKPRGTTPRDSAGHPDLTGMWGNGNMDSGYTGFARRGLEFLEPDQAAMQRAAGWNKPLYKPELWEKVYGTDYGVVTGDPHFKCLPMGVPRMNAPIKIVQTPTQLVFGHGGGEFRFIPTDGRKRDDIDRDYDNYNGVPLGRWDGDTLVIDSVGFTENTWFLWSGYFHSAQMTVQERLRRVGDVLYYQFTVTDPEVLAQPWVSDTFVKRLNPNPLARLDESAPCKEQDEHEIVDKYYRG